MVKGIQLQYEIKNEHKIENFIKNELCYTSLILT